MMQHWNTNKLRLKARVEERKSPDPLNPLLIENFLDE